jgi:hypothetical protein
MIQQYPATVVAVDATAATVRLDDTGQLIKLAHEEHNAVPVPFREIGTKGAISFPKAPAWFDGLAA